MSRSPGLARAGLSFLPVNGKQSVSRPSTPPTRARRLRPVLLLGLAAMGVYLLFRLLGDVADPQSERFRQWWQGDAAQRQALITTQRERCPGAPFVLPADGFILSLIHI